MRHRRRGFPPLALALLDELLEYLDLFLDLAVLLYLLLDRRHGVHRGGMVAVELLSDVVVGKVEQLAAQVDGYLARVDDVARAVGCPRP